MKSCIVSVFNWSVIFKPICNMNPSKSFSGVKYMYPPFFVIPSNFKL